MQPIVHCEHVCVAYGRRDVLHDVCLELPGGVIVPFVGPNGAGKTTLLRAILGLVPLRTGHIRTPFARHPPGYVPQQKAIDPLYPVSARRIVEMGLYPSLGPWRRMALVERRRVDEALDWFGLAEHQNKTFGELSGGMRQKILLARAFVTEADVLILDEPTSELDEASESEVLAYLKRLCREQGKTVLLAYHGWRQAAALSPVLCQVEYGRARLAFHSETMEPGSGGEGR